MHAEFGHQPPALDQRGHHGGAHTRFDPRLSLGLGESGGRGDVFHDQQVPGAFAQAYVLALEELMQK